MRRRSFQCILSVMLALALLAAGVPACLAEEAGPEVELELTEEERALVESAGTLKVGYVQDRIPVSFQGEDGSLSGITRDILDRLSEISGLSFEYVALPAGAVTYQYLMEEGFDLVTSVEYNRENQSARGILISQPYLTARKVVVVRSDFNFDSEANLSVAISSGSQTIEKVLHETYPNYSIVNYGSIGDCFDAVNEGEADMMILNQYVVEYWLYKPVYEELKVIPLLGLDDQMCFSAVVPFDENGEPVGDRGRVLISVLDKAIAQLTEAEVDSFTIGSIMENRYSFTMADTLYRYRYSVVALVAAGVLIIALAVLLLRMRLQSVEARADARAKSEFLSTMSHEIRTPLNGLIGLNYLMSNRLHDQEQMARYLERSTSTAKYLLSLVSDILDMSLLHKEDVRIERRRVDLRELLETVEAIVRSEMEEKGLDFRMDAHLSWPAVMGDEVRIQQVLLNLLDNAKKFTAQGGGVTLTVRQAMDPGGKVHTRMEVADTGKGMSEAFQKNIFEAFVQERDTVSKGDEGVGLGLAISHRLAKLMDGDLNFTSELGKGSVFQFSFPSDPAEGPEEVREESAAPGLARPRILVAEDNELNGEIMLEVLSENGFQADLAENGQVALQCFRDSPEGTYGVILMDLLMPVMNGFQAAAAIRGLDRADAGRVRIFACSANCTVEDREKALESGMDDFLAKPLDIEALLKKLSA